MSILPQVSVIIPTYNRAEFIGEALRSLLKQTLKAWEAVVVDDGSIDHTEEIVRSLKDSRIQYRYQTNQGVSAARNHGIELTSAPYIAFLDSDDLWEPHKLEEQIAYLKDHPDVGLLYGQIERCFVDTGVRKVLPQKAAHSFSELLQLGNVTFTSSVVIKRECLKTAGLFDPDLHIVEDYDLWLRIARVSSIAYLPGVCCRMKIHSSNSSANPEKLYLGYLAACQKLYDSFAADMKDGGRETEKSIDRYRYLLAGIYLKKRRPGLAYSYIRKALFHNAAVGSLFLNSKDSFGKRIWFLMKPYFILVFSACWAVIPAGEQS